MSNSDDELFSTDFNRRPPAGRLIKQFVAMAGVWGLRNQDYEHGNVTFWVLLWTGGIGRFPSMDRVDTSTMSRAEQRGLSARQLLGRHTLEQVEEWLLTLVETQFFYEPFLIASLIERIDSELEDLSENYGVAIAQRRQLAQNTEEALRDIDTRADFLARTGDSDADVDALLRWSRKMAEPSLDDMRSARLRLDTWRELSKPILERENLFADHLL